MKAGNPGKKVILIILDGWGHGDGSKADAIAHARTPFMDSLYDLYPNSELRTSGEDVGLPEGQMGNSEVGHLNIGAGRVVYQDLVKINKAVREGSLGASDTLRTAFNYVKSSGKRLHLMGLCSDGGVHSHIRHLFALCDLAKSNGVEKVFIHAFTDGRDCDPKSGLQHLIALEDHLRHSAGELVSVIGRYYAMDRDRRWERVKLAYDLLVNSEGRRTPDMLAAVSDSYKEGVTDEFIRPILKTDENGLPAGRIGAGDAVICFNFRTDRCREISTVLTQKDMAEFGMATLPLHYVTMTNYDDTFRDVDVIFGKDALANTLGEVLSSAGLRQVRVAETEKYPHVTFFFSGGREEPFPGEERILIHSPKVATYDLQPEMSADKVTDAVVSELRKGEADFMCLNFANPDMVGHTGVYEAIVKAVEATDACANRVVEAGTAAGYSFLIIADHGNADCAINADGTPNTAHTTNPVPCILIDKDYKKIRNGILADVAPTVLKIMGLEQPGEMTGKALV